MARESAPDGAPQKAPLVSPPTRPSAAALARRHDIPTTTLYRWFARYPGLAVKVGGRYHVDPVAWAAFLAGERSPRRASS